MYSQSIKQKKAGKMDYIRKRRQSQIRERERWGWRMVGVVLVVQGGWGLPGAGCGAGGPGWLVGLGVFPWVLEGLGKGWPRWGRQGWYAGVREWAQALYVGSVVVLGVRWVGGAEGGGGGGWACGGAGGRGGVR